MRFQSTKQIDGFSTCFRQWKAEDTNCKFTHGYSIYFGITFEGELDYRNWVTDFGFLKRSKTKIAQNGNDFSVGDWFKYMFDHTIIVAENDPKLELFFLLDKSGTAQVRILPNVGCEMFAKFVFETLNKFLFKETDDRVRVVKVECFEHSKNSAIYSE